MTRAAEGWHEHEPVAMTTTPQKITFGEMRATSVRDVLIYCRDVSCSHHVETSADGWSDEVTIFCTPVCVGLSCFSAESRACGFCAK